MVVSLFFLGGPTKIMLSGKMTKNQFLKVAYNNEKTVDICEFVKIQRPISAIDGSITIIFRCRH